ncbi:MAG: tryptophan synthase subunit alpha [Blastopirellula sp. JB062]
MSSIDQVFAELRDANRKAFIPFVTAGDPSLDATAAVLKELSSRGGSICELGIPYSDPIADGPVIQASYTRALDRKIKLSQILDMANQTTPQMTAPLVTMVSYAIILRHGPEEYVRRAKAAGVAGAIVPDLLVEESADFAKLCQREDFSLIQLVTPTTSRERALRIAETSTGFIYYVSVAGITGERTALPADLLDNVAWLRNQTKVPICIGFGISRPEHVRTLKKVADGVIVGSAIVRRMSEIGEKPQDQVIDEVGAYAETLIEALNE